MKRSTLSLALATVVIPSFSLISNQAVAQETNTASVDETINVIGSRLSLRTATDGTAPVDIITEDELTAGGFTETAQALQYAVPSFIFHVLQSLMVQTPYARPLYVAFRLTIR